MIMHDADRIALLGRYNSAYAATCVETVLATHRTTGTLLEMLVVQMKSVELMFRD